MGQKYVIASALLLAAMFGCTLLACCSRRIRDICFAMLVTLSTMSERFDVNFVSREWYRGTTCGFELSLVDVLAFSLLVSSILVPRRGEKRWFWPASLGFMLLFLFYAVINVAVSDPKLFGLFALSKMFRGLIMFLAVALYVRNERELRIFIIALGLIVCWQGVLGLKQRYGEGLHRVVGTLNDPNSLSMYLCLTAPLFVAALSSRLPRHLKALSAAAIAMAVVGAILSISRAGTVSLMLVLLGAALATVSFRITARKIAIAIVVMGGITGILAKSWETLGARFGEATISEEYEQKRSQGRGYYIRIATAIVKERPFGVGPNNWSYWVSNKYGPKLGWRFSPYPGTDKPPKFIVPEGSNIDDPQAAPAHSLAALTVGEMGFAGLFLFAILWMRWFQMGASFLWPRTPDPMRRLGVGLFFGTCGIFLQSITEWVFHQTPIFFTFNIMLGVLASLYYVKKQERRAERARAELDEASAWPGDPAPAGNW